MLNFDFLEKGLGVLSPPHFLYHNFSTLIFLAFSTIISHNFPENFIEIPQVVQKI